MEWLSAFLSGMTRVLTREANSQLATNIGSVNSAFYNYLVGSFVTLLMAGVNVQFRWTPLLIACGLIGVAFVLALNWTGQRVSALPMTLCLFIGQMGGALLLDGNLSLAKAIGALFVLVGLVDYALRKQSAVSPARSVAVHK